MVLVGARQLSGFTPERANILVGDLVTKLGGVTQQRRLADATATERHGPGKATIHEMGVNSFYFVDFVDSRRVLPPCWDSKLISNHTFWALF